MTFGSDRVLPGHLGVSGPERPVLVRESSAAPWVKRHLRLVLGLVSVVVVLGTYSLIAEFSGINHALLPTVNGIISQGSTYFANGIMWDAIGDSVTRVAIGYGIGCTLGIVVGSLRGWFHLVEYVLDPIIEAFRPIPALAYIPLVILWFGIGQTSRVLVLTLASFLTSIVNVTAGMKEVPAIYVQVAQTLGASRRTIFMTVAVPASLPYIFTGLRVASAAVWATLVAAELIAAQNGLGYLLEFGQEFIKTALVMDVIVIIGILGFMQDRVLRVLQRHFTRWAASVPR